MRSAYRPIGKALTTLALVLVFVEVASAERFRWRGEVDGSDEILIQGREVTIRHLDAQPIRDSDYRFSAPLPARAVEVTLRQVEGRGRVRLMEQPSSRNDYTVVVRIEDPRGGDDTYEFELTWDEDIDDDRRWERDRVDGWFRWEGRVDIGVDIEIRGDEHVLKDMGGRGTREFTARFAEPLPSSNVQIHVEKIDGRGDVELRQAPTADNDFTAIIRIEDDRSGADNYVIEVLWRIDM